MNPLHTRTESIISTPIVSSIPVNQESINISTQSPTFARNEQQFTSLGSSCNKNNQPKTPSLDIPPSECCHPLTPLITPESSPTTSRRTATFGSLEDLNNPTFSDYIKDLRKRELALHVKLINWSSKPIPWSGELRDHCHHYNEVAPEWALAVMAQSNAYAKMTQENVPKTSMVYTSSALDLVADRIIESKHVCVHCDRLREKIRHLYERSPALLDIPTYTSTWINEHQVPDLGILEANVLPPYYFFSQGNGEYFVTSGFLRNLALNVESASNSINLFHSMTKREKKEVIAKMRKNPFLVMVGNVFDSYIAPLNDQTATFFKQLYEVRKYLGYNNDQGHKPKLTDYQSQGPAFPVLASMIQSIFLNVGKTVTDVSGSVMVAITKVFDTFVGFFGLICAKMDSIINSIKQRFIEWTIDLIHPVIGFVKSDLAEFVSRTLRCLIVVLISIFVTAGILSGLTLTAFLHFLLPTNTSVVTFDTPGMDVFKSQGPEELSAPVTVAALLMTVLALTKVEHSRIKTFCLTLTAIVAGGTAMSKLATGILTLLPGSLRYALLLKFGSSESRDTAIFENWMANANALYATRLVPSVAASAEYLKKMTDLLASAPEIARSNIKPQSLSSLYQAVTRLLQVSSFLNQKHYDKVPRSQPYSIHIASKPGIGKTLLVPRIIQDAFGFKSSQIFTRNSSDEYWSGFNDEPVIFYDEFVIGSDEVVASIAQEYLDVVSTGTFKPNLPSLDSVATGIKGTSARPKLVVSANNTLYNAPFGIPSAAFQRRRNYVVEIRAKTNTHFQKNSYDAVDLHRYTSKEIFDVAWADFYLHIPEGHSGWEQYSLGPYSYAEFIQQLADNYRSHQELATMVESTLYSENTPIKPPMEIVNEVLGSIYTIPKELPTVWTSVVEFFSQGPRTAHIHNCCDRPFKHGSIIPDFVCKRCGMKSDCATCPGTSSPSPPVSNYSLSRCSSQDSLIATKEVDTTTPLLFLSTALQSLPYLCEFPFVRPSVAKIISTGIALTGMAFALYTLITGRTETVTYAAHSPPPQKFTRPTRRTRAAFGDLKAQGSDMPVISFVLNGFPCRGIPLCDHWILSYGHCTLNKNGSVIPDGCGLTVTYNGKSYVSKFNRSMARQDLSNDTVIFWVDNKQLPQFKNIKNKFLKNEELLLLPTTPVTIPSDRGNLYTSVTLSTNPVYSLCGTMQRLEFAWVYLATTKEGDCGDPLVITTGMYAGKIIGLHVAGSVSTSKGLATLISHEDIQDALGSVMQSVGVDAEDHFVNEGPTEIAPSFTLNEHTSDERVQVLSKLPNCRAVTVVPPHERVHLNRKTKLQKSILHDQLLTHCDFVLRELPVLSSRDPRARGIDPVFNSLKDVLNTTHKSVDPDILESVADTMLTRYWDTLKFPAGQNALTFEQACSGIPGVLSSINVATSPGFPLCLTKTKSGKKDHAWFDESGEFQHTPEFRKAVEEKLASIQDFDYVSPADDHRFVGYLKDELVSHSKVENVRTRMIFANDVVASVAFRMKFGAVLAAFNNSAAETPLSIGLNQYSNDMNTIYSYLAPFGDRFIAGDYKSFDKRMHPYFQWYAYLIFLTIGRRCGASLHDCAYLYHHEVATPMQVEDLLITTKGNHFSGNFLTTIINCLVNEMYFRYIFAVRHPTHLYDEHIRAKFLGDDHIINVKKGIEFNPIMIRDLMATIGQEYTSAFKDQALTPEYVTFDKITFLGAHPRIVCGLWSGAMKKSTLYESLMFTRDRDQTLLQTVKQMMECASQWDRDFYESYKSQVMSALKEKSLDQLTFQSYGEISRAVASRTSTSEYIFTGWLAQGARDNMHYCSGKLAAVLAVTARLDHDMLSTKPPPKNKTLIAHENAGKRCGELFREQEHSPEQAKAVWEQIIKEELVKVESSDNFASQGPPDKTDVPSSGAPNWGNIGSAIGGIAGGIMGASKPKPADKPAPTKPGNTNFNKPIHNITGGNISFGKATKGITTLTAPVMNYSANLDQSELGGIANLALNSRQFDMSVGPETRMYRNEYQWLTSQAKGTILASFQVPFDLLAMGEPRNLQNMPFERHIYFTTDIDISFQLNSHRFSQGLLVAYYVPLVGNGGAIVPDMQLSNIFGCSHVFISPDENTSTTLHIPYQFFRSALNTYAGGLGDDTMGMLFLRVVSPLVTPSGVEPVVTMFASFSDSRFTLPRPLVSASGMDLVTKTNVPADYFVAQGMNVSKPQTNNTYNLNGVFGDVPIENGTAQTGSQSAEGALDLKIPIPMDKPPMVGGAIPTYHAYSSMSKSIGLNPTTGMTMHPASMNRQHQGIFNPEEVFLQNTFSRRCLLSSFTWTDEQLVDTTLFTIPLNSVFGTPALSATTTIPFNVALLNEFLFWRSDIVFEFVAVRNAFQSGRLMATVAYGAPGIQASEKNVFENQVLDYSGDNKMASITVVYNAATEFLKTYSGPTAPNQVQDYSLGYLLLTVGNRLVTVAGSAKNFEVLVFVSFVNTRVMEMRPHPGSIYNSVGYMAISNMTGEEPQDKFVAQGPGDGLEVIEELSASAMQSESTPLTESESVQPEAPPCRLTIGNKFEFEIKSYTEILRRYTQIYPNNRVDRTYQDASMVHQIAIELSSRFGVFFAGWAGSLNYRIVIQTDKPVKYRFVPEAMDFSGVGNTRYLLTPVATQNPVPIPWTVEPDYVATWGNYTSYPPYEIAYPVSGGQAFIDLLIPFNTILNFLSTIPNTGVNGFANVLGFLVFETAILEPRTDIVINQAVSDDFRMGIFRPPYRSLYRPIAVQAGRSYGDQMIVGYYGPLTDNSIPTLRR